MEELDVSRGHLSCSILLVCCPELLALWWDVGSGPSPGFSFAQLLLAWKHVQLSHHSVSAAVSLSPRLKTAKGPPGKVARPVSQDLCQKCFSPQVICYSLGSFHYYFKEPCKERERERNEREEKWYLVVGSDRSTFLSIDMRSEWGVFLWGCWLSLQQSSNLTDKKHCVHGPSPKIKLSQTNWLNSKRIHSHSYTNRQHTRQLNVLCFIFSRLRKSVEQFIIWLFAFELLRY